MPALRARFRFPLTKAIHRRWRRGSIDHPAGELGLGVGESFDLEDSHALSAIKVVLAESGLGWGAYLLEYTDFQATGDQLPQNGYDLMPSELFKRQCYLVGWYDKASLRVRRYVGTENILWSSQFPQATSTWPKTKEALIRSFEGVDEGDKQKILWENAAKLYKIAMR
jgi:predicted TIM-barrel fold metal-dependent hydrolase